ncbi:GMC family oxidoreductase N-terminal domain-containing protein [Pseudonocardia ailaonensis]|uniref:GMC family oxidoreductase N-terminal domain-containing protein n=1 Tax=Pseudonocardia ailaonensis TaxID=367279 RepID=A0ABN2N4D2_9PSEU
MGLNTVIIGSGSSGSALAARLSEDDEHEVLLLEAGPDYPDRDSAPPSIRNPYDLAEDHDWGLEAYFVEPATSRRTLGYPRGRVVGGSSNVNASIAHRGTREDFAKWVALGNDRWDYDSVLPYYARLEADEEFGTDPHHSAVGPVAITRVDRARWPTAVVAVEESLLARGYPACPDHNAPDSTGVGSLPRNQAGEVQANGLFTYIHEARKRPNLTIRSGVTVRRLLFDGRRVSGVEVTTAGGTEVIPTDRVVLAAGAINTPHILTLSGVGPAEALTRLGIDPVCVLDGVGRNLQDHPLAFVVSVLKSDAPDRRYGALVALKTASAAVGEKDDIMLFPPVFEPSALLLDLDLGESKAMSVCGLVAKPRSTGWITVTSADPDVRPEIHLNFLAEPDDMSRLMEIVRLGHAVATSEPVARHVEEVLFPAAEIVADDDLLRDWLRANVSTGYHAAGTCRMGPSPDDGAVVDQRLRVHGLDGVWVADASIMPVITTGLTNLTAFMIGERAADLLGDVPGEPITTTPTTEDDRP